MVSGPQSTTVYGPPSNTGSELFYAYTLVDPSGEMPEDAVAFSFEVRA